MSNPSETPGPNKALAPAAGAALSSVLPDPDPLFCFHPVPRPGGRHSLIDMRAESSTSFNNAAAENLLAGISILPF